MSAKWEKDRFYQLKRLLDAFGDIELAELRAEHVWKVQAQVREAGLSAATFNRTTAATLGMVRDAEAERLVPFGRHKEILARVSWLTEHAENRNKPWSLPERDDVLSAFRHREPYWYPYVLFLFGTGARLTEVRRLDWKHVKLSSAICRIPGTKTAGADRTIQLPRQVVAALSVLRDARTGPVFRGVSGGRVNTNNWRNRVWWPLVASLDVEQMAPRCNRHTFALAALRSGWSALDVAFHLGTSVRCIEKNYLPWFRVSTRDPNGILESAQPTAVEA